jgi:hypothetical protein
MVKLSQVAVFVAALVAGNVVSAQNAAAQTAGSVATSTSTAGTVAPSTSTSTSTASGSSEITLPHWVGPLVGKAIDTACYRKTYITTTKKCGAGYNYDNIATCWTQCPIEYPVECGMELRSR